MSFTIQNNINILNVVGLLFDIIGVLFLFKNGLPSPIDDMKPHMAYNYDIEKDKPAMNKIRRNARSGIILVIIGFVFQFLATIYNVSFCH